MLTNDAGHKTLKAAYHVRRISKKVVPICNVRDKIVYVLSNSLMETLEHRTKVGWYRFFFSEQ